MLIRNKRDDAWVFHSELIHVFLLCRNFPLSRKNGSSVSFGDIFRIERHCFKVAFDPQESKVGYRVICGSNVIMKPRKNDGSDTIIIDEGIPYGAGCGNDNAEVTCDHAASNSGVESLLADEELEAVLSEANGPPSGSKME